MHYCKKNRFKWILHTTVCTVRMLFFFFAPEEFVGFCQETKGENPVKESQVRLTTSVASTSTLANSKTG